MTGYVLRRLLLAIPLLWVVSTAVFLLVHLIPGDPVDFMVGENAELSRRTELRQALHLDLPVLLNLERPADAARGPVGHALLETQYAWFVRDLLSGEARSLHTRRTVRETVASRLPYTLRLAAAALVVAALVAIPLGTLAARRRDTWVDHASMTAALVGVSMPNFWLGPLLILLFAVELGWAPVSGAEAPGSLVLPALTLGLGMSAVLTRITRTSVLDVLGADFVRTARAKGAGELRVLFGHALRTALIPVLTILGLQFGALLAGSIITEEIFGWPGLGREVIGSIRARDFPVVQGCVLAIAGTYVLVNTATDVLYAVADPRVRPDR